MRANREFDRLRVRRDTSLPKLSGKWIPSTSEECMQSVSLADFTSDADRPLD
jgi:hypothetical protein